MEYAFKFADKGTFVPSGKAEIENVEAYNKEQEAAEIAWLKSAPNKCFLYVHDGVNVGNGHAPCWITTWLGTRVSDSESFGGRVRVGFGFHSYRRSVDCRIFGTRYVGWYMESSGSYCRLRKAKVQDSTK